MSGAVREIDPITLEVVRNRSESIVREMGDIILRTARSSVAHHGRDFSCGIFDRDGEMMAIGTSIALHTFPLMFHLRKLLERFRGDIRPGDIFVGNDPWEGGLHPNDITIAVPVFYDGELVAFSCTRIHHYDVGGMVPGSISGSATDMYQEGLHIPLMRLGRNDQFDENILEFILRNVRVPVELGGDLWAQLAGCRVGAQRVSEIMDRYGRETTENIWKETLNAYERRCRALIAQLPQTTLVHEGYLDSDGVRPGQLRIRVTLTINEDSIIVDYTGISPQTAGPNNVTLPLAISFAYMGVKAALDPSGPINSGYFRPIEVIVPEGSLLSANPPAAVGGQQEVGQAAILIMAALSKLREDSVSAEEGSSTHHMICAGTDSRSQEPHPFIFYESQPGGGGARSHKDGLDFVRPIRSGNGNSRGIEILERTYPLFFLRNEFQPDSGGPGKFRGGLGLLREYRTSSDGIFSVMGEHAIIPPAGLFGGYHAAPSRFEVVRDGEVVPISPQFGSKATAFPLKAGDVVRVSSQGGGGWGDPLERDPQQILADVLDGRVSMEQARDVYGLEVDPRTLELDLAATQRARADLAGKQIHLRAKMGGTPAFDSGVRVAWVSQTLEEREGHKRGDLAVVFAPNLPTPVLVRIGVQPGLGDDSLLLDEEAWQDMGLEDGQLVLWRGI